MTPDSLARLAAVRHETEVGPVLIVASAEGIARIALEGLADFAPLGAPWLAPRPAESAVARTR